MFKRIVVGTDGSVTAGEAVDQAVELARRTDAELDIVSAYQPVPRSRIREAEQGAPGDVAHEIGPRQDVMVIVEAAAKKAQNAGVRATTHPREGDAADALIDVAEEHGAELIVVGSKGMTGARRFLLGSVPNRVSHHASCGVWIVRTV